MTRRDDTDLAPGDVERLGSLVGESHRGDAPRAAARFTRIAVVAAEFNGGITARLLDGAFAGLKDCGFDLQMVTLAWVPGAFELPLVADHFATDDAFGAVICLGAVIRGDTPHFEYVSGQCAAGLQRVAVDTGVPVVFGVLTTDTIEQALERAGPGSTNKGYESAVTALEMLDLLGGLPPPPAAGS